MFEEMGAWLHKGVGRILPDPQTRHRMFKPHFVQGFAAEHKRSWKVMYACSYPSNSWPLYRHAGYHLVKLFRCE